MKIVAKWENVGLTQLFLDPSADSAEVEISSCFDGSILATIFCRGIMNFRINSALAANGSELPVFIGEIAVVIHTSGEAESLLLNSGYGFRFDDSKTLPRGIGEIFEITIKGGEIEAHIIAIECTI